MSSDVAVYLTYNQTGTWDFRPLVQTSAVTSIDDHQRIVLDGKVHLPAMGQDRHQTPLTIEGQPTEPRARLHALTGHHLQVANPHPPIALISL